MKKILLLCVLAAIATLFAAGQSTPAKAPEPATTGERLPPERLDLKVLKVYSAKDGEALFRAYVVNWKGQEVIVSDTLVRTKYKEGDTITVLAMNHPYPQGREPHRLLGFTVAR